MSTHHNMSRCNQLRERAKTRLRRSAKMAAWSATRARSTAKAAASPRPTPHQVRSCTSATSSTARRRQPKPPAPGRPSGRRRWCVRVHGRQGVRRRHRLHARHLRRQRLPARRHLHSSPVGIGASSVREDSRGEMDARSRCPRGVRRTGRTPQRRGGSATTQTLAVALSPQAARVGATFPREVRLP